MDEQDIEKLINASENIDSILLLSKMAQSSIENDVFSKTWDLYGLFGVFKKLSDDALSDLRNIQGKI
jgi:hypothetical protein